MTAVAVEICSCAHAPRMHERDEDADLGRGVCAHRSCGCSGYRPASVEVAPVAAEPTAEPSTARATWGCADCGQRFDRPQGLGSHRRYVHPKTEAPAAVPPTAAGVLAQVAAGPQAGAESGEVSRFDPGPAPATPSTDVEERRVHPDDVLVGLVRALEAVVDGEPSVLLEQALDIRRYMDDRGWRLIDAGTTTTGATP